MSLTPSLIYGDGKEEYLIEGKENDHVARIIPVVHLDSMLSNKITMAGLEAEF